jgi:hypothetical protein
MQANTSVGSTKALPAICIQGSDSEVGAASEVLARRVDRSAKQEK